jgi:hypothetical protein
MYAETYSVRHAPPTYKELNTYNEVFNIRLYISFSNLK